MLSCPTRAVEWLQLIRWEFEEPSDLCLTLEQAHERWPLELTRLTALLDVLVDVGYLRLSADRRYSRSASEAPASGPGHDPASPTVRTTSRHHRRPSTAA